MYTSLNSNFVLFISFLKAGSRAKIEPDRRLIPAWEVKCNLRCITSPVPLHINDGIVELFPFYAAVYDVQNNRDLKVSFPDFQH